MSEAISEGVTTEVPGEEVEEREEVGRARRRWNEETRNELEGIRKLGKVKGSLKTILANKLARTQLQKVRDGPITDQQGHRPRRLRRRVSGEHKRRRSWVVGEVGGGARERRKEDEEELKSIRSMGVVKKRLQEEDKMKRNARKMFKQRIFLYPKTVQKSDCILVTGYGEIGITKKAAELIRQQSMVVIENFFNQPANPRVLNRLTSVDTDMRRGEAERFHRHTRSEPHTLDEGEEEMEMGREEEEEEEEERKRFERRRFGGHHRGRSLEEDVEVEERDGVRVGRRGWGKGVEEREGEREARRESKLVRQMRTHEEGAQDATKSKSSRRHRHRRKRRRRKHREEGMHSTLWEKMTTVEDIEIPEWEGDVGSAMQNKKREGLLKSVQRSSSSSTSPHPLPPPPSAPHPSSHAPPSTDFHGNRPHPFSPLPPQSVTHVPPRHHGPSPTQLGPPDHYILSTISPDPETTTPQTTSPQATLTTLSSAPLSAGSVSSVVHVPRSPRRLHGNTSASLPTAQDGERAITFQNESGSHDDTDSVASDVFSPVQPAGPGEEGGGGEESHSPGLRRSDSYVNAMDEECSIPAGSVQADGVRVHELSSHISPFARDLSMVVEEREEEVREKEVVKMKSEEERKKEREKEQEMRETREGESSEYQGSAPSKRKVPPRCQSQRKSPHVKNYSPSPRYSVVSLPGGSESNTRFYTPLSPHLTGTHMQETNPFAADFNRALKEKSSSGEEASRNPAHLSQEALDDEGFKEFLSMTGKKPSHSAFVAYKITLISEQIDCKYSKQLNQALDTIFHEVLENQISWENFSSVCRTLLFKGEALQDGLFMIPAFGRRLLEFLPSMRDTIASYTQEVFDKYAMEWLLDKGGWGELLRHYSEEEDTASVGEGEEGEEEEGSWSDRSPSPNYSLGYGLDTPAPENQNRSLATAQQGAVDISDVSPLLHTIEEQTSECEQPPLPLSKTTFRTSDLFLAPLRDERGQFVVPPMGLGMRRVNSVEVLFAVEGEEEGGGGWNEEDTEAVEVERALLTRVNSLPSISSSTGLSSPIPIPSRTKCSTDPSSFTPGSSSPNTCVFSLPSMRREERLPSHDPPPEFSHQVSVGSTDSAIRIITGNVEMDQSPPATGTSTERSRQRHSSDVHQPSNLCFSRTKETVLTNGNRETTETQAQSTNEHNEQGFPQSSATPGYNETDYPQAPPTPGQNEQGLPQSTTEYNEQTQTTLVNGPNEQGHPQRSLTGSSGGYEDYGMAPEDDSMGVWDWIPLRRAADGLQRVSPVLPHLAAVAIATAHVLSNEIRK